MVKIKLIISMSNKLRMKSFTRVYLKLKLNFKMKWKSIVAFLVDILATLITAFALVLMKQAHHSVEDSEVAKD